MLTLHQTKISDFLYLRGPIIEMNRYPVTKDKPNFKPPYHIVACEQQTHFRSLVLSGAENGRLEMRPLFAG